MRVWRFGTCVALVLAAGCVPQRRSSDPGRPRHLVLISLDTTRADHMGFYGSTVKTPMLDRLAAESVVLDDFMSVAPTTLVSHTSLFTGTYPHTHGVPRNGFVVSEENVMLAEVLREQGFATAAFVASFALAGRFNVGQGFQHYDEAFERFLGHDPVVQNERSAATVTDAALRYLDDSPMPERLLLFVHYFDPHLPYAPPAPYDTLYDPRGGAGLPSMMEEDRVCPVESGHPDEIAERTAKQYAGEVTYLDEHVGRLIEGLRTRGILDEALVVVTSDHGENFWEHPRCFNHGWDTYQTTLHSIGLFRLPGARHGGVRIGGPTSNIDILPTVLGQLGVAPPEGVEGQPIGLDPPAEPDAARPRFGQASKPWDEAVETDRDRRNARKQRCIRLGKYKLIQTPYLGTEELYDLEHDPLEQHDLLRERPQEAETVARELRPALEAWATGARSLPTSFENEQQEETLRRLEALGYLGGD